MGSMVNTWLSELTKLRQTIKLEKTTVKKSTLIVKSREAKQLEEESRMSCPTMPVTVSENQASEETIFWLMDRFAPC
ncbi:hypothetical protein Hanom_Chr12g01154461 [Helianthus anomalus]